MIAWFSSLPTWVDFLVTVSIANGIALVAMSAVRLWSARIGVTAGPAVVNSWATCVGGLTALLFAFTIVTVWNSAARAHSNVDDEAAAIRLVARDIAPAQLPALRAYTAATVAEWPELCGGRPDGKIDDMLIALQRDAKPRSAVYADDLYRQLGAMEDLRNRRWQTSTSSIPKQIWKALIVLSLALMVVLSVAMPERYETHLVLMIAVATAIGTLFWVATVLEYPFCGSTAIGPSEILDIVRSHSMS